MNKEKKNLISVIVPVYNVEKYLVACIESILSNTYKNIEVLLVDDGSTDASGQICDDYAKEDNRIKVIHKKNQGVGEARNDALEEACGEWVVFVDADDTIRQDYFEILLREGLVSDADIVCCSCIQTDGITGEERESDWIPVKKQRDSIDSMDYIRAFLSGHERFSTVIWSKLIKAKYARKVKFLQIAFWEDTVWMLQVAEMISKTRFITFKGYNHVRWEGAATLKYPKYNKKRCLALIEVNRYIKNKYWSTNVFSDGECIQYMEMLNDCLDYSLRTVIKIKDRAFSSEIHQSLKDLASDREGNIMKGIRIKTRLYFKIPCLFILLMRVREKTIHG